MRAMEHRKIGANIAAFRKARGLTQEQLAEKLGVSAPAVSKWETGNSCPDITLLCPLARALGTNVDTLLQFEKTLSDQEVIEQINGLLAEAPERDPLAVEERLRALLHQYPGCTALQFHATLAYDTLQMFFPQVEEPVRARWTAHKRALLEEIRTAGNTAYWQTATIGLVGMCIAGGELQKAEALLKELPERTGDPAAVWTQYYLKKGEPDEALKRIQKQLYQHVSQIQTCLTMLTNPQLLPEVDKREKVCRAYRAVARAFGFPDMSDGLVLELCLDRGEWKQAADCFARYVEGITGPAVLPDEDLFTPGLHYIRKEGQQATTKGLRRLLLKEIQEEERFHPLRTDPTFAAALEKLKASV